MLSALRASHHGHSQHVAEDLNFMLLTLSLLSNLYRELPHLSSLLVDFLLCLFFILLHSLKFVMQLIYLSLSTLEFRPELLKFTVCMLKLILQSLNCLLEIRIRLYHSCEITLNPLSLCLLLLH